MPTEGTRWGTATGGRPVSRRPPSLRGTTRTATSEVTCRRGAADIAEDGERRGGGRSVRCSRSRSGPSGPSLRRPAPPSSASTRPAGPTLRPADGKHVEWEICIEQDGGGKKVVLAWDQSFDPGVAGVRVAAGSRLTPEPAQKIVADVSSDGGSGGAVDHLTRATGVALVVTPPCRRPMGRRAAASVWGSTCACAGRGRRV